MPKTPSDNLFRLVKSLTGSEKRYFKLFVGETNEKNSKYLELFDAIDQQEQFDDDLLRVAIYGTTPIESRKYSELKAYLYDLLLRALQSYDHKSSVDFRLKNMLSGVRALYRRSHFDEARQLLHKAKKLALRYEQFHTLTEVIAWEKQIAYAKTDITFLSKNLTAIQQEESLYLQQQQTLTAFRNLFLELLVILRTDAALRSEAHAQKLQSIIEDPLLNTPEQPSSIRIRILYQRIYSVYFYAQKNFERFYQSCKTLIELMEEAPHLLKEDVSEYISALSNYVMSCGWLKKFDEVEATLPKFRKIRVNTHDDELKIHRQYFMIKLSLCIQKGDFKAGLEALQEHQRIIASFSDAAFRKHTFYFQYFYIYFGSGNYDEALVALNDWLNLTANIERKDLQSLARILNLIIHYEMGNAMLLQSLLRSTYRFLKKQPTIFQYEQKMLDFFRRIEKP
ncbi:MAG: hypothetical protein KDC44_07455, partial [Phaeodactylibacter sp.]|nr:hypothetical protein [Phaeodactylibacter sp.]